MWRFAPIRLRRLCLCSKKLKSSIGLQYLPTPYTFLIRSPSTVSYSADLDCWCFPHLLDCGSGASLITELTRGNTYRWLTRDLRYFWSISDRMDSSTSWLRGISMRKSSEEEGSGRAFSGPSRDKLTPFDRMRGLSAPRSFLI